MRGRAHRGGMRPSMDGDELINLLHRLDLVKVKLNGLENEVRNANTARSAAFLQICGRFSRDFPLNLVGGACSFKFTGP
ncbi:hypothetical protein C1H46_021728 [Malus baccata]|uniref:Uncharacterized protein n=1 Tax=Malus baccata TaxID=106549 RepID=A0A540M1I9_MALBA|nr:hypothetical protein C1H46_021728 [Malus baccata]